MYDCFKTLLAALAMAGQLTADTQWQWQQGNVIVVVVVKDN
jgi:hypothetical protein